MGMFDEIRCKYPLPLPEFQDTLFQTKDTDSQYMDLYEIREDGSLWKQEYDVEDHSNKAAPEGSIERFIGCMTRVNKHWKRDEFTGAIDFYDFLHATNGWIQFQGLFKKGQLVGEIELVRHDPGSIEKAQARAAEIKKALDEAFSRPRVSNTRSNDRP